jgi:hypothetical protein
MPRYIPIGIIADYYQLLSILMAVSALNFNQNLITKTSHFAKDLQKAF